MTSKKDKRGDIHTISFLVNNKPGVLVRVALVFARRGYNIDALVVSPSFDQRFSRMTITAQGEPEILDQIIKQAYKLIDVIHVVEHSEMDAVHQELALIKIKYTAATKTILLKWARKFNASVLDESPKTLILAQAGSTEKLDEFERLLKKYSVVEMVRSGKLVMAKGGETT